MSEYFGKSPLVKSDYVAAQSVSIKIGDKILTLVEALNCFNDEVQSIIDQCGDDIEELQTRLASLEEDLADFIENLNYTDEAEENTVIVAVNEIKGKIEVAKSKLVSDSSLNIITSDSQIAIGLNIAESDLALVNTGDGVAVQFDLVPVGEDDLEETVKEAYTLVDKNGNKFGSQINIYKDSTLQDVYVDGQTLILVYLLADGTTKMVTIDFSQVFVEGVFKDGLIVKDSCVYVRIDDNSEEFLTVSDTGVKLSGVQDAIDASAKNLQDQLDEEIARATAKENEIEDSLNNEILRATTEDAKLEEDLANEISRAQSVEEALQDKIDTIESTGAGATTKIEKESSASHITLSSTDNSDGSTTYIIGESDIASDSDLQSEISRATSAENTLTINLNNEINNRESAISSLESEIDSCQSTLEDEISTVQDNLSTAQSTLQDNIDSLESSLTLSIASETTRATNREDELESMITASAAGVTTSVVKDSDASHLTISSSISSTGAITYTIGESDIASASDLTSEISRATQVEDVLSSEISSLSSNAITFVNASGTSPLTLSASESDNIVTISGSVDAYSKSEVDAIRKEIESEISTAAGGGITSISVSSISPLSLSSSVSDGVATITGSVDTYSKSEIDEKISSSSSGITSVTASGTSPLTLSASTSGGAVSISGSVDLSSYATKDEIPTNVSQLANDSGYLVESDLSSYAKTEDVPTKISELENDSNFVTESTLDTYAKIEDITVSVASGLTNKVIWIGTEDEYNTLTKDSNTIYFITESNS